jgi:hypothetical protein
VGSDPITDQLPDPQPLTGATAAAGAPSDNTTLLDVLSRYEQAGFTGQFGAEPGGLVHCYSCGRVLDPQRVELVSLRRLEGASDPDDMLAVAAVGGGAGGAPGGALHRVQRTGNRRARLRAGLRP